MARQTHARSGPAGLDADRRRHAGHCAAVRAAGLHRLRVRAVGGHRLDQGHGREAVAPAAARAARALRRLLYPPGHRAAARGLPAARRRHVQRLRHALLRAQLRGAAVRRGRRHGGAARRHPLLHGPRAGPHPPRPPHGPHLARARALAAAPGRGLCARQGIHLRPARRRLLPRGRLRTARAGGAGRRCAAVAQREPAALRRPVGRQPRLLGLVPRTHRRLPLAHQARRARHRPGRQAARAQPGGVPARALRALRRARGWRRSGCADRGGCHRRHGGCSHPRLPGVPDPRRRRAGLVRGRAGAQRAHAPL
ncbi:hypothetical protein D3C72_1057540 [compost metagenome]